MDYVRLGKLARSRRNELKLTQENTAEKMNVSVTFYGNIERGTKVLSVETLYRLCMVLGVSADYLMGL